VFFSFFFLFVILFRLFQGIKQRVERLEKIDSMIDDAVYTLDELVDQFKFSNLGFGGNLLLMILSRIHCSS